MMRRIIPVVPLSLSALLIAAHFLRSGNTVMVVFSLLVPLILLTRERWALIAIQVLLVAAAAEWVRTALIIANARIANGAPTMRTFIIVGAVAVLTLLSALPLNQCLGSDDRRVVVVAPLDE